MSLSIIQGRHPVIEQIRHNKNEQYTPNDCLLSDKRPLILLTGPNMGGKSTYLRQCAIIIIMAQAGFYVPASQCKLGVVDKIFSRLGSADNLTRNESTFMVLGYLTGSHLGRNERNSVYIKQCNQQKFRTTIIF